MTLHPQPLPPAPDTTAAVTEGVEVPLRASEQVLKAIGRGIARDFRQLPAILALHRAEQSSEIGHGTRPRLSTGKDRANASLQLSPILVPDLHIKQINLVHSRYVRLIYPCLLRARSTPRSSILLQLQLSYS